MFLSQNIWKERKRKEKKRKKAKRGRRTRICLMQVWPGGLASYSSASSTSIYMGTELCLGSSTSDPVPCLWPGEQQLMVSAWAPDTQVGGQQEILGFCLQLRKAPAVVALWRVKWHLKYFFFSSSFSVIL